MKRLLPLVLFISSFANAQTGSLSGNVFWKYNDYVGNKADAGSEVHLILLSNPVSTYKSTCDLQGNYKIDGVLPGRYFLIIKSKNTKQDPIMYSRLFDVYKHQLDSILGINISDFRTDIQSQIDSLYKQQLELVKKMGRNEIKLNKYLKEDAKIKKDMLTKIEEWFNVMSTEYKLKLDTYSSIHESFHYQIVDVQANKNEAIVTDFGTTYM